MVKKVTRENLDERERNFLTGYMCASEAYRYRRPGDRTKVEKECFKLIKIMRAR